MSAPLAGQFQDHYQVLGIDPRANIETIRQVCADLKERFHPENPEGGNKERFEAVTLAYEILSDPFLRKEFDKLKGLDDDGGPQFTGVAFFDALGRDNGLRAALLCVLYDQRRKQPTRPSLSMRNVEGMLTATAEEWVFVVWYLKQKSLVESDDKSSLRITVEGIDFLEKHRPTAESVMPFIKGGGVADSPVAEVPVAALPEPAPPPQSAALEPPQEPEKGSQANSIARLRNMLAVR